MSLMRRWFPILCLAMAASAPAQKTIRVPADQPTIQAGISAASTGDTVLVAAGTYYENIDFKGKAITVTSADGAATTILDGQARAPVVSFVTGEIASSVLSSFTIRNGGPAFLYSALNGAGGIYSSASPSILNNVITANVCYGIYSTGSPRIQGNRIGGTLAYVRPAGSSQSCGPFAGSAYYQAAASSMYGVLYTTNTPVIVGNTFEGNVPTGTTLFLYSAMLFNYGGQPIVENNIIRNNGSSTAGSGAGPAVSLLDTNYFTLSTILFTTTAPRSTAGD